MKIILILVCLLLLFYNFESNQFFNKNVNERLVILWKLRNEKILLHIFPHDQHVLIDGKNIYLYLDNNLQETYVPAVQLESNDKRFIVNYSYLWGDESPKILKYPSYMESIVDILNYLRQD